MFMQTSQLLLSVIIFGCFFFREYGAKIKNVNSLKSSSYEDELRKEIKASKPFPLKELEKCSSKTETVELPSKG